MISKKNPTKSAFWEKLSIKAQELNNSSVSELFEQEPNRFDKFSIQTDDILIDFSKNLIDEKVIDLLIELAKDSNLKSSIDQLFNGDRKSVV